MRERRACSRTSISKIAPIPLVSYTGLLAAKPESTAPNRIGMASLDRPDRAGLGWLGGPERAGMDSLSGPERAGMDSLSGPERAGRR